MNLEDAIKLAKSIAEEAHEGQFRNDGITPYMRHVQAVADAVEDRLKPIAYLHDVIEDTNVNMGDLIRYGFDLYIIVGVQLLTHDDGVSNMEYWKSIAENPDATHVKIADIKHNLSSSPSDQAIRKYHKALALFKSLNYST